MTNQFTAKTNFTAGELSPDLMGRVDLSSYQNGAKTLENVMIEPTGGVHRRPGLQYISTLSGPTRLINYDVDNSESYLILIQNQQIVIYHNDTVVTTLSTPWVTDQINKIRWCAISDGLILVHPDVAPQQLTLKNNTWSISEFIPLTLEGGFRTAYSRFGADSITISSSGCTGNVTLTASADLFAARHVNQQMKLAAGYVLITSVTNGTHANATVQKKLIDDDSAGASTILEPTRSWGEIAWNSTHGWPMSVATYQSRLVFGGSKSLPNTLWFSQTDDIHNFEEGDALDSEAITFSLLSDQSNKICALFSGRHLQVFTTSAEWMVTGDPLTPTSIQLKRQTQVGSTDNRYIPPVGIDGATIFAAANGHEIREFLFSDLEGLYQATDLSLMAHHLIAEPIDMAYDKYQRQAYIIMNDGTLSVLTSFRAEDMQSWTHQKTHGKFISVAICSGSAYFVIQQNSTYYLEKFSDALHTDCGVIQSSVAPKQGWDNLNHLNNQNVAIVADGRIQEKQTVTNNTITLPVPVNQVEVGLAFTHTICPLPPSAGSQNGPAPVSTARFVRGVFRLLDTNSFEIDTGSGLHQEIVENLADYQLDAIPQKHTLDLVIRGLGWKRNPTDPLWTIQGSEPLNFKLLSVVSDIKIGG